MSATIRRMMLATLAGVACHPGATPADPPPTSAERQPAAEPKPQPEPEPQPEPNPEPEPDPAVVAPDGTVIAPCEDPPPGMACIPGGPFVRGRDDGPDNEKPGEEVWLQTFYMDLYEVRTSDYKACRATNECLRGRALYNDFSRDDQPIVGPNWYAAVRFCEVAGKHLPTEAQWEKAARGPDGALHPWGDEPADCERAVIKDERGRSCGVDKRFEHPKKGRTFEVGSRPAGVYGLFDMSGNAWEWVADWASESYAECGDACRGTDPLGPCEGKEPCKGHEEKVVRGGSWYWDARYATGTYRRFHFPANDPFHHFGFRCAASLDEARAMREAGSASGGTPSSR